MQGTNKRLIPTLSSMSFDLIIPAITPINAPIPAKVRITPTIFEYVFISIFSLNVS